MAYSPAIKSPAELKTLQPHPDPGQPSARDGAALPPAPALEADDSSDDGAGDDDDDDPDMASQMNLDTRRKYVKGKQIGAGTYGIVYAGYERADPSRLVAIKKIKFTEVQRDMGIPPDALREMKALQELSHPNILALHDVFTSKQNINMVLELLPNGDMEKMIKDRNTLYSVSDMKAWMLMLCKAVWFCHENNILHRDIKPNNIFIAANGEMKLADFGLCRTCADPGRPMTSEVITSWYRPPELFYGARYYGGAVDIWSVATTFAELVQRRPYLEAWSDAGQLSVIYRKVGTPTEQNWPGVSQLEVYRLSPPTGEDMQPVKDRAYYRTTFPSIGAAGQELMARMLILDPRQRITARDILMHEWWTSDPRPTRTEDLPKKPTDDGESKKEEAKRRRGGEMEARDGGKKIARKLDFGNTVK